MINILFFSRLFLYLLALAVPIVHQSIVVPYDVNGWLLWFLIIPGEMIAAKYIVPPKVRLRTTLVFSVALLGSAFLAAGGGIIIAVLLGGGVAAFLLTFLVFNTGVVGRNIAVFEQFFIAFIYYRLLNFSRASEDIAGSSSGVTQLLLAITICSFLIHSLILTFAAFRNSEKRRLRKEVALLGIAAPVLLVLALLMPPNFVEHSIVFNPVNEDVEQPLHDHDGKGWPENGSGKEEQGEEGGEQGEEGEESLQGIPSDKWSDELGKSGPQGKQYAVMLVISPHDPVYAAEAYHSDLHPERGFLYDRDEPLNELTYTRLLETWQDDDPPGDNRRAPVDIRYMTTQSNRVLQYRPSTIEPTVLNMEYHPFDYTYHGVSMISMTGPREWSAVSELGPEERSRLSGYLELPLDADTKQDFQQYLDKAYDEDAGYYERIRGILINFDDYQYELGFDDSVGIQKLRRFITEIKSGDCTEFSNTAALLGRMAGIPSRVVTGYLASKELQSMAHQWGIQELRKSIPQLQEYPFNDIYLVTTAHHHSWVQYYLPQYGWVDFETTSYAIPPPPGGDPNAKNVIIPIIEDIRKDEDVFHFPWRFLLRVFLISGIVVLSGLYLARYTKEGVLSVIAKREDGKGLRALYTLLLMKKAAEGWRVKKPSETAEEYAEAYPDFRPFADVYTTLRYKEQYEEDEKEAMWRKLREHYRHVVTQKKKGFAPFLKRLFNLKGLYY